MRSAETSTHAWRAGWSTGGLEEVLTGWVLGQLPDGEDAVTRAERTAVEIALRGLVVE